MSSRRVADAVGFLRGLEKICRAGCHQQQTRARQILKHNPTLHAGCKSAQNAQSALLQNSGNLSAKEIGSRLQVLVHQMILLSRNDTATNITDDDVGEENDLLSQLEAMRATESVPEKDSDSSVFNSRSGNFYADSTPPESPTDFYSTSPPPYTSSPAPPSTPKSTSTTQPYQQTLSSTAQARAVPSSRFSRVLNFGGLAVGLGVGAAATASRQLLSGEPSKTFISEANAERIVRTLCKVRGAALKLGQMLSIQDSAMVSPQIAAIMERVRQSADFMPERQMLAVLTKELGADWRHNFLEFEERPFAAASIGQVHRGTLRNGQQVAVKIQYPGVADSIESDVNNLLSVLNVWNIFPKGLYAEQAISVAKRELALECNYEREAECGERFVDILSGDEVFEVPRVIHDLSTKRVLTTELKFGISLDQCADMDQETRDWVGYHLLRLCLQELFVYRFMQTDPNWSNFLYNAGDAKICLLDFGASRDFDKNFVDSYLQVIQSASRKDQEGILKHSVDMGFLTGFESRSMQQAHCDAVLILGEAFASSEPFDFGNQSTSRRIHKLIPVMLEHRVKAPPEETYSLHRKMAGAFLLCAKLRSRVHCGPLFDSIAINYKFF